MVAILGKEALAEKGTQVEKGAAGRLGGALGSP